MTQRNLAHKIYYAICDSHDPTVLCDICKDKDCWVHDPNNAEMIDSGICIENIRNKLMEWNKSTGKGN